VRHYKLSMLKFLTSFYFTLLSSLAFAQAGSIASTQAADTTKYINRHGSIVHFVVAEALIVGTSYYASKPGAYGDKVIGWLYAASSAAMLVYIPFFWTDKSNNLDNDFKKDRIWNTVAMVGLSYGFSRIATYNLLRSEGDTFNTRFKRNLIESHAAYFIPIVTGALTQKLLFRKTTNSKVKTNLQFDGSNVYLTMTFK
jgi:hypothetical protein